MVLKDLPISPYKQYCDGFGNPAVSSNGYFIGFVLGVGQAPMQFYHQGSFALDGINAFDLAEIDNSYIGQINMSIVSSFCGPQGLIWGYDCLRPKNFIQRHPPGLKFVSQATRQLPVYSGDFLLEATQALFGTNEKRRFPLLPGSHVPCAGKNIKKKGPTRIYSAIGIGIAKNPKKHAHLLMEDVGEMPILENEKDTEKYEAKILENIAKSVSQVGINQRVHYQEVLVMIKSAKIEKGQIGCALVAAPYFTLAQKAIPDKSLEKLQQLNLNDWEKKIKKSFLDR